MRFFVLGHECKEVECYSHRDVNMLNVTPTVS